MSRRFLYMVVGNCSFAPRSYTLHRINPSRLFYPKDSPKRAAAAAAAGARATTLEAAEAAHNARTATMQEAEAALRESAKTTSMMQAAMRKRATQQRKADAADKARLPPHHMKFTSPGIVMDFALLGESKDKILVVDAENPGYTYNNWDAPGRAVIYDDASHSVRAQLCIGRPESDTVPVAVGDNLYFMEEEEAVPSNHGKNLRALIRYPAVDERDRDRDCDWFWYSFPPPPYDVIGTGAEDPRPHYPERRDMLGAYAVVGESHIWASTRIRGTYSLDTESGTWSKAIDSPLPFSGRAEYAPEHGLWFGFPNVEWQPQRQPRHWSWDNGLLGAWDLNSARAGGAAAPLQGCGVWEGFGTPSGSFNVRSHLLRLGDDGRFCVAKLYKMRQPLPPWGCPRCYNDGVPVDISFAVLTGVEVERCDGGELRMIKHRSCKYAFGEYNFAHAVL